MYQAGNLEREGARRCPFCDWAVVFADERPDHLDCAHRAEEGGLR